MVIDFILMSVSEQTKIFLDKPNLHGYNIINRGTSSIIFSMWQFDDCLVYVELYNDKEFEFKFI